MELVLARDLKQRGSVFLFFLFALIVTFIFRDAGDSMLQSWTVEEYSHGYLIPPLAILLLVNRMIDGKISPQSSWLGFFIVTVGVIVGFLSQLGGIVHALPQIYVLSLIGTVTLFLGAKALRTLAGPLILLLFATPLPTFFYYAISTKMQAASTSLGVIFLDLMNVPVFQDGNIIDLGGYQLNVVEACSGVRYLFPLLCLSFLLAYMFKAPLWKRAVVFLSTAPIAILLNGFRIALIGVTVDLWGSAMAEGVIHESEGVVVFIAGLLVLLLEIKILQQFGKGDELRFDGLRIPTLSKLPLPAIGKPSLACAIVLLVAGTFSASLPYLLPHYMEPIYLRQPFTSFPLQIGAWIGQPGSLDSKELKVLGTDDYLLADYAKKGETPVSLYTLYYAKQDSASNQAVHTPTVCIPSGGWTVRETVTKTIPIVDPASSTSRPLEVNKLLISKGETREIVYYWYAQDGRSITSPGSTRIYTFLNSLVKGRSNGGLVRLVTQIAHGETENDAEARLNSFLDDGLPTLYGFMFYK